MSGCRQGLAGEPSDEACFEKRVIEKCLGFGGGLLTTCFLQCSSLEAQGGMIPRAADRYIQAVDRGAELGANLRDVQCSAVQRCSRWLTYIWWTSKVREGLAVVRVLRTYLVQKMRSAREQPWPSADCLIHVMMVAAAFNCATSNGLSCM